LFLQIIDICAADNSCEMMLQPLGYCPELIGNLILLIKGEEYSYTSRRASAKVLQGLVTKCCLKEVEIPSLDLKCKMGSDHVFLPVATVPNQVTIMNFQHFNLLQHYLSSSIYIYPCIWMHRFNISSTTNTKYVSIKSYWE